MDKMTANQALHDLTLALIYLTRQADKRDDFFGNGPFIAWKNYNWDTIDSLDEEGLVESKHGNKSLWLTHNGSVRAREILAELDIEDWKPEDVK